MSSLLWSLGVAMREQTHVHLLRLKWFVQFILALVVIYSFAHVARWNQMVGYDTSKPGNAAMNQTVVLIRYFRIPLLCGFGLLAVEFLWRVFFPRKMPQRQSK